MHLISKRLMIITKKELLKYAKVNIIALKESKLPDKPSQSQIDKALEEESKTILNSIPKDLS